MNKLTGFFLLSLISSTIVAKTQDGAPKKPLDVSNVANAIPAPLPYSKYGNPDSYRVDGKTYHVLKTNSGYEAKGYASWYGTKFQGKKTSSGEIYNMYAMTAASPVLPIPSFVKVINLKNHKSVIVKVNDRGPFHQDRIMDLSYAAASKLNILKHGTALVKVIAINTGTPPIHQIPQHFIQVAAFSNGHNAKFFVNQLQQILKQPVHLKVSNDKTLYRIRIGPITNEQIPIIQNTLKENGFNKGFTV